MWLQLKRKYHSMASLNWIYGQQIRYKYLPRHLNPAVLGRLVDLLLLQGILLSDSQPLSDLTRMSCLLMKRASYSSLRESVSEKVLAGWLAWS